MKQSLVWDINELLQSPLLEPLHPALSGLGRDAFPNLQDINGLLERITPRIAVQGGHYLRFVAQPAGRQPFAGQYEPRCFLAGEVQTRERNWHDLFNALVWLTFPLAKAAINARHYHAMAVGSPMPSVRTRGRDMLTLLDESGVLVAYAGAEWGRLVREFRWKELFWQRRSELPGALDLYLFGHGLYEKAMTPYVGMTGQGLLLEVERDFFAKPLRWRLQYLDEKLAQYLSQPKNCLHTRELTPVPLLGRPGWSPDNSTESYYDDASYFRPGRLYLQKLIV